MILSRAHYKLFSDIYAYKAGNIYGCFELSWLLEVTFTNWRLLFLSYAKYSIKSSRVVGWLGPWSTEIINPSHFWKSTKFCSLRKSLIPRGTFSHIMSVDPNVKIPKTCDFHAKARFQNLKKVYEIPICDGPSIHTRST